MDELLCGLSETSYNNTISIGQLKSATDAGMRLKVRELYCQYEYFGQYGAEHHQGDCFSEEAEKRTGIPAGIPDAARSYTSLLEEIKRSGAEYLLLRNMKTSWLLIRNYDAKPSRRLCKSKKKRKSCFRK